MPRSSRLAQLQQMLVAAIAAASLAWLAAHWASSPVRAIVGALAIFFSYSLLLALQCVLLWDQSRHDTAPRPTLTELLRAWWAETVEFPRVFFWRQPFRWREVEDSLPKDTGKRGFVFVHGFMCNRGFWTPWLRELQRRGHVFAAVNLEPVFGSIDDYAPIVDAAVRDVTAATGMPPVLVCHSMGGLAARAWLRAANDPIRIHRLVTIASPHHGTFLARLSHMANGKQMRMAGPWLQRLAESEFARPHPPTTCWYSNCDHIVFPVTSATLPWADNCLVPGPAHVELGFHPQVMHETLALAM